MIESTTQATAAAKGTGAAVSSEKLKESYDSFLTLLTAQIANQDPLNPVDSTQFVSQLAQLSQVEQGIATNTNLEAISAQLASTGAMADMQLIGRHVQVPSDKAVLTDGTLDYSYQLDGPAETVTATILAEDGTVVRELTGLKGAEDEVLPIVWNGMDSAGLPVPDGRFEVRMTAKDAGGTAVGVTGLTTAQVQRVDFTAQGSELTLSNGESVLTGVIRAAF